MARTPAFSDSVFLNCPFDPEYQPLFEALVFAVVDCGFVPRCAMESPDAGIARIDRICGLIAGCRFSVHDLSRVELSGDLPRFNMPFELGLDLGCRRFGSPSAGRKKCLVLDRVQYRYRRSLSDIAGQDICAHENLPDRLIATVRGASSRTCRPSATRAAGIAAESATPTT